MNNTLFTFVFLFVAFISKAQFPTLIQGLAENNAGVGYTSTVDMAIDKNKNYIVCGNYNGTVDFDFTTGVASRTATAALSTSDYNAYVAKYDSVGKLLWLRVYNNLALKINALAVDSLGDIFMTGKFSINADFDPSAGVTNLTALGSTDCFVTKLSSTGIFQWAKSWGANGGPNRGLDIAADANGKVYFTIFADTYAVDIDPDSVGFQIALVEYNSNFIVTLNAANGKYIRHQRIFLANELKSIEIDNENNIVVTGFSRGSNIIIYQPVNIVYTTPNITYDLMLVAKFDTNYNCIWSGSVVYPAEFDKWNDLFIDKYNNIYVAGSCSDPYDLDLGPGTSILTPTSNSQDAFVAKYDKNGNYKWARLFGNASGFEEASQVAVTDDGKVYTWGEFDGNIDLNPSASNFIVSKSAFRDIFVSCLDSNGNFVWGTVMPGTGNEKVTQAITRNNTIYLQGYEGRIDLDLTVDTLNTFGMFIAKYGYCKSTVNSTVSVAGNTLTANQANATYQWVDCNNGYKKILGETKQTYTSNQGGNFAVIVKDQACIDTSACIKVWPLALEELRLDAISIYPNPFVDYFTINLGSFLKSNSEMISIKVMNMQGVVLKDMNVSNANEIQVSMQNIPAGIYCVNISIGDHTKTMMVVK